MTIAIAQSEARELGRNAAYAVNEATLLRDVLIGEIRALGALYCVGKRRPISELTPEQQQRIRYAYKDTQWASDYGVEMQGIYTSEALAEEACKAHGPNWFYTKLPIDSCLPDVVVFGEWAHIFPGSDKHALYKNTQSETVAIRVGEIRALQEELFRLQGQIDAVNSVLQT